MLKSSTSGGARTATVSRISLRLRELSQLYNSFDPSPFPDRDLDADAEAFIVSRAQELPSQRELELVIQLAIPPAPERAAATQAAVRNHFAERADAKRRALRQLMRVGRKSLCIGLVFLVGCLTIGNLFEKWGDSTFAGILNESLLIAGWVAMWRPIEIYLYAWWPLLAERRVLQRLSLMSVRLELADLPDGGEVRNG